MTDPREWHDTQSRPFVARHMFAKAVWRDWAGRGYPGLMPSRMWAKTRWGYYMLSLEAAR